MSKYKLPKAKELLEAGVHFGHQTKRWHPKMQEYIYTVKKNIHIIDLENTESALEKACEFLYETAKTGGQIVFVGTKRQAHDMIETEARRCGALFVNERWLGGTMTNFPVIKKRMKKLVDNIKSREEGLFNKYTKKERLLIDREIEKLQKSVGGLVGLTSTPQALFIIDAKRESTAVKEANSVGAKTVALVDTNTDPTGIDYVIPGNDDAIKSVALILETVANAVEAGYQEYAKVAADKLAALTATSEVEPTEEVAVDEEEVTKLLTAKDVVEALEEPTTEAEVKAEKPKKQKVNKTKKEA